MLSPLLEQLIEDLQVLPGIGRKSAQRMALQLLERRRDDAAKLCDTLGRAVSEIGRCEGCRTLSETPLCPVCSSSQRDKTRICVVESPAEMLAVEQGTDYRGGYFVLLGRLSPLDGIGPDQLGLDILEQRLAEGGCEELILATNPTVEGEATAQFIAQMAQRYGVSSSRIAYGVPVGGDLDFVDGGTLSHAFSSRQTL
ncbi:MAG: recombination mediator RecR [Gammaproteobacteria bacterium]|nr:recombination mediator RecR [Gammaproteobacteria bacterium]